MHEVDLRAEERNAVWLRGLTGSTSIVSWLYSCGCLSYCIYLLLKVEPAILPSLNMLDIQTALTMVTGMAGACGSITLKRGPLLLHCCITTVECLGYLAAGTVALRNRVTIGSRLEMAFNEILKDYTDPKASDEIAHKLHTIQAVLRCCGKNGGQDFIQMERPHPCGRAVLQYGCLRAALNLMATELFHQSCVGLTGAFLLLFSLFSAASLMTSLRKDS
ncbi:tetraspanin 11 [Echinococcus multilocularis]|uniref:Tetraspanin 11 n=1 Tax=Echinococcus multilocularis TaxID=6211 RepID=A0A068YF91_ECHMU|nr:tetraspanin 11 [Echinococcus multilocularis]